MMVTRALIYLGCLLIMSVVAGCQSNIFLDQYDPGYSPGDAVRSGSIRINPETLLIDLKHGRKDVFEPITGTFTPENSNTGKSFLWTQTQYLKVAEAVFEFVWKEPIALWNFYKMGFTKSCQNGEIGFEEAAIVYFKEISVDGERMYLARDLTITPSRGQILWGETDRYLGIHTWKKISFEALQVTADDVLLIAENNGGRQIRSELHNACTISIRLVPNGEYEDWRAGYVNENTRHVFDMTVDPESGEYKRLDLGQ